MPNSKSRPEHDAPIVAPTLDQRLARLEAIVLELESGGVPLESAIERYQEGVELLKDCRAVLAGFRKRVEELSQSAEESLRAYAQDPDAPGAAAPGGSGAADPLDAPDLRAQSGAAAARASSPGKARS
jgi:exodeoxyribonuclease VII small subunit